MTDREKQLRSFLKWNHIGMNIAIICAVVNALTGSLLWILCLGAAVFNWWVVGLFQQALKDEGYDEL